MTELVSCPGIPALHCAGSESDNLARPDAVVLAREFQTEYSRYPPTTLGPEICRTATWYGPLVSIVSGWRSAANAITAGRLDVERLVLVRPAIAGSTAAAPAMMANESIGNRTQLRSSRNGDSHANRSVIGLPVHGENCIRRRNGPQSRSRLSGKTFISIRNIPRSCAIVDSRSRASRLKRGPVRVAGRPRSEALRCSIVRRVGIYVSPTAHDLRRSRERRVSRDLDAKLSITRCWVVQGAGT